MVEKLKTNSKKTLREQFKELTAKGNPKRKKLHWEDFFGKVKFEENPVEYQRKRRNEWE